MEQKSNVNATYDQKSNDFQTCTDDFQTCTDDTDTRTHTHPNTKLPKMALFLTY